MRPICRLFPTQAHVHGGHGLPARLIKREEGVCYQLDHTVPPHHLQPVGEGQVPVPALFQDLTMPTNDRRQQLQLSRICIHHLHPVGLVGEHKVSSGWRRCQSDSAYPWPFLFAHHISPRMCGSHNYCLRFQMLPGITSRSRPLAGTDSVSPGNGEFVAGNREVARLSLPSHNIPLTFIALKTLPPPD